MPTVLDKSIPIEMSDSLPVVLIFYHIAQYKGVIAHCLRNVQKTIVSMVTHAPRHMINMLSD